jgi:hypothetical protein
VRHKTEKKSLILFRTCLQLAKKEVLDFGLGNNREKTVYELRKLQQPPINVTKSIGAIP